MLPGAESLKAEVRRLSCLREWVCYAAGTCNWDDSMNTDTKPILVIGAGITGMTAALESAELGYNVLLVEKEPFLGGRVLGMNRYFPKMCPPACGFEINVRRLRQNPRVTVHTLATVEEISGHAGRFEVRIKKRPRYVTGSHSLDDAALAQLETEVPNGFNYGMDKTKAVYLPHAMAYPPLHVMERDALSEKDAETLLKICPPGAIDLNMGEDEIEVEVGAIIVATGWHPYDAAKLDNLGFGRCGNVITNVMMERLAARGGPTGGEIVRPSDGRKAENVAFVQCAGSRDENHLPYCSAVCCMASLKQARYVREKNSDSRVTVFYIDIRAVGRHEKFYYDMLEDPRVSFVKGKVAEIQEDHANGDLILDVEDTMAKRILHRGFDLVVLATGMVPNTADLPFPFDLKYDAYGFVEGSTGVDGVYAAGCAKRPCDVSKAVKEAMAASIKAIQSLDRGE
jgi:quinone-modifying oxidoreductase subunit QmoA